jgi:hypothetical protein
MINPHRGHPEKAGKERENISENLPKEPERKRGTNLNSIIHQYWTYDYYST